MRLATGDVKLRGLHRPWQPRRWQRPVGVAPREQHGHRFDERRLERRHRTGRSSLRMASLHTYPCEQVLRHGAGRGQLQLRRWRWRGPSRSGGASGAHISRGEFGTVQPSARRAGFDRSARPQRAQLAESFSECAFLFAKVGPLQEMWTRCQPCLTLPLTRSMGCRRY